MTATLPMELTSSLSAAPRGSWLQVLSHIDPRYGGLSSTVPALAEATIKAGMDVRLAAFCNHDERFLPTVLQQDQISYWPYGRNARSAALKEDFRNSIEQCDGVHIHGLWEESTAAAASAARTRGVPYVLSAHGMLEPWALRQKRLKKLVYSAFIERRNVARAACLHALTHAEAGQYREFGGHGPIAIIPNGITVPSQLSGELFLRKFPELQDRRIVLFLARLHAKKGLHMLIEAWKEIAESWPAAQLVIAGPDSDGEHSKLQALVNVRGLGGSVLFTGMLNATMKWSALAAAESFILPSFSEGLSVGVLEAMGAGLPVLVTHGCNMPEVQRSGAGWTTEATQDGVASALRQMLSNTAERNQEIGRRGARLIQEKYSWATVGRQMADLYTWLQGGPQPSTFELIHD